MDIKQERFMQGVSKVSGKVNVYYLFITSKTATGQGPLTAAVQVRIKTQKHSQSHTHKHIHPLINGPNYA